MVYFAHALHLEKLDQALVNEPVEAWQFGPVFSELFDVLRNKNVRAGRELIMEYRLTSRGGGIERYKTFYPILQPHGAAVTILNTVYELMFQRTAEELVSFTHSENQPWYKIMKEYGVEDIDDKAEIRRKVRNNLTIPDDLIKQCFRDILREAQEVD